MESQDPTYACVGAFAEEIVRAGVAHACIMPGARSTPLALTLATQPGLRAWSHIDERSGAFFALGIAKASRRPVAVVCTSGTAAANLLPAVVEACYAHTPLLLLTADRPPELRDCGAAQTIDQIKLFGTHVKWAAEVGSGEAGVRYFRAVAAQAVARACAAAPGPVHLNFPFREPLLPTAGAREAPTLGLPGPASTSVSPSIAAPAATAARALAATLAATPRGLITCGPHDAGDDLAAAVTDLAKRLGYPVLADPTSQCRSGSHDRSMVLDAYDSLFRHPTFADRFAPDLILRFGPLPTSKAFTNYVQQHPRCRQLVLDPLSPWNDPTATAAEMLPWDPVTACAALNTHLRVAAPSGDAEWASTWSRASHAARGALHRQLDSMHELFEGKVFAQLAELLPDGASVYVGNSMPVRDLETFWAAGSRRIRFLCNRGANGIDGFVSSGLGAAAVSAGPLIMVTGDVGFYHDLNGLLAAKRHRLRALIILINNDGGGIFSFLPQAQCNDALAEYFVTPHGLDFRGVTEMYGCRFTRVASWHQFRSAVLTALTADATSVIEVPSDRERNVELHRHIWSLAAEAITREVG